MLEANWEIASYGYRWIDYKYFGEDLEREHLQKAIAQVCQDLELSYTHLPSRASHDAQELARIADMGMIFVPSKLGVSHDATEYTSPEQCIRGANVLLGTLLQLDCYYLIGSILS